MPRKKVSILYTYEQRKLTPLNTHTHTPTKHTHTHPKKPRPDLKCTILCGQSRHPKTKLTYTLLLKRVICVSEKW